LLNRNNINIQRKWKTGDMVEIILPMHNTVEHMPNVPEYIAFMYGPILLSAKTSTEDLAGLIADDGRWSQYAGGEYLPVDKAPILIEDDLENIGNKLEPFSQIHDARYMMYYLALTNKGYQAYVDSLANIEKEKLALEKRTIDYVATGEQQPETDHAMKSYRSGTGINMDEFYREARGEGFFSYDLATNSEISLSLFVRYWGGEYGNRKFDIFIDDKKLITEDNTGRWNQSLFKDVVYTIPDSMAKGKSHVRIKFEAPRGSTAGAVCVIRLLRQ
jgi:hypothetical protein